MPPTIEQLRDARSASLSPERYLDSPDRNVCVAALRVLAFADGPSAIDGVLRGLDDPVKRVREVAARAASGSWTTDEWSIG